MIITFKRLRRSFERLHRFSRSFFSIFFFFFSFENFSNSMTNRLSLTRYEFIMNRNVLLMSTRRIFKRKSKFFIKRCFAFFCYSIIICWVLNTTRFRRCWQSKTKADRLFLIVLINAFNWNCNLRACFLDTTTQNLRIVTHVVYLFSCVEREHYQNQRDRNKKYDTYNMIDVVTFALDATHATLDTKCINSTFWKLHQ